MEALCKELSCPVCLDLFTPPVLELPCSHNYCKKCITQTLIMQNCTHVNGQFICPMCRKVIHLRGKGINGIKRNIFAENVLEKIKEEMDSTVAKDKMLQTQMCPVHNEVMTLVCLADNTPICSTCKLFGDHSTHAVARVADVFKERTDCFTEQMKKVKSQFDTHSKHIEGLTDNKKVLLSNAKEIEEFMKKLGTSLIWEIQMKVSTLILRIQTECTMRCKLLEDDIEDLTAPERLYTEMEKHLEASKCPIEFLKEERRLHEKAKNVLELSGHLPMEYKEYISLGKYVEDMMSGIDVKKIGTVRKSSLVKKMYEEMKAWKSGRTHFDATDYRSLDIMLTKAASLVSENSYDSDGSLSWEICSSSGGEDNTDNATEKV